MSNKLDKFRIKFLLMVDLKSKYVVNGFPYLGADDVRTDRSNRQKKKPKTVEYYNKTKCGVDTVDQMTRSYSVKYPTRRWPIQVWCNILNMAGINSCVLFREANNSKITRKKFLSLLIDDIVELVEAEKLSNVPVPSTQAPSTSASASTSASNTLVSSNKRKFESPNVTHCQVARECKRNRSMGNCGKCRKSICGKCAISRMLICKNCG